MRYTLTALLLAALTACGGSSEPVAKTQTPAVTTPAAWTVEEAGNQYLKMVAPSNNKIAALSKLTENENSPHQDVAKACKATVPAQDQFMRDLTNGQWPTNLTTKIDALIAEVAATRAGMQSCAEANTYDQVVAGLEQVRTASKGAAQVLRVALGLPGTK